MVDFNLIWNSIVSQQSKTLSLYKGLSNFETNKENLKLIFKTALEYDLFPKKRNIEINKKSFHNLKSVDIEVYFKQYFTDYFEDQYKTYEFKQSNNVKDPAVSCILSIQNKISETESMANLSTHSQIMGIENKVGDLLEDYIEHECKGFNIVRCAGKTLLSVDFITFDLRGNVINLIQVKNRSNSENSSSSRVRKNTKIVKWYRLNAKTGGTLWTSFPLVGHQLSESKFLDFVKNAVNGSGSSFKKVG